MIGAVIQGSLEEDHGIPGQNALVNALPQPLFNGGEEVPGHAAAEHVLGKDQILLLVLRLEFDPYVAELAVPAGLLLMAAVGLKGFADLLTIGHAGGEKLDFDAKLVFELGAEHVEMNVSGAGNDQLAGLAVVDNRKGLVLLGKPG